MIGSKLSHFRIEARLGAGGMGEVYRAHDERLDRDVAIKVLPADHLADETSRARLRREARALSRVSHPNICTVHEFDTDGDVWFIAFELLEGETLADRLRRGPLDAAEVRRIGGEIAGALEAAHEQGVVHRDLKPANVMITWKGVTKVLDFGLARVERAATQASAATQTNLTGEATLGTLPYMAPEQLRGDIADARTDVYALGATLYEMATGRRPFPQTQSLALAAAILGEAPPSPRSLNAKIDSGLEGIILRCMEKDPARRFSSTAAVAVALAAQGRAAEAFRPARWPSVAAKRGWLAAGVVLAALAAGVLVRGDCAGGRSLATHGFARALAVLPLSNLSGDATQDYFADGMTEELITTLGQISSLRVTSRSSVMRYKGGNAPLRKIAKELGVDLLVEGAVMRSGDQVRISTKLIEGAADRLIWSGSFDRALTDVFSLQNEVARALAQAVRVRVTPQEVARLQAAPAADPRAHEAYLRGRELEERYTQVDLTGALKAYQQSVDLQPTFAPAYVGVANTYLKLSGLYVNPAEAMPRAEAAAEKALDIDSTSGAALAALAYVKAFYRFDWTLAESDLRRAIALNPSDPIARSAYSYLLTVNSRFEEGRREAMLARQLDPFSQAYAAYSLFPLYEGRRYAEVIRETRDILTADSTAAFVLMIQAQARIMSGDPAGGAADLKRAMLMQYQPHLQAYLMYAYRRMGNEAAVEREYRDFQARSKPMYVQPYTMAVVCLARGRNVEALTWLERAVDEHTEEVSFLNLDPVMDPIRTDPRYRALVRRIGART